MQFIITDTFKAQEAKLKAESLKYVQKLLELIFDIDAHPFTGLGKPEPLKGTMTGHWSRRITDKHRLIYRVEEDQVVTLVSCYGHYDD